MKEQIRKVPQVLMQKQHGLAMHEIAQNLDYLGLLEDDWEDRRKYEISPGR
jgi:hypothetical protein